MSDDFAPSYHEAGHALAAYHFGLSMTHVSIRERPGESLGRCTIQDGHTVDDFTGAIVMIAGHVAERMALGRENVYPNWFLDDPDTESARVFLRRQFGEDGELEARQLVQLRARVLLRMRWEAVQEIAERLERDTTLVGEEVAHICLAEAARRSARSIAASPPKPRPAKPAKKPRRPSSGDREVRPFTFTVVEKEGIR
jgi:hypothetical protein